jgi:ribosomal protein L24
MSKRQIEQSHRVEITEPEFKGRAGRVSEVFKTRGQPTVYTVRLEGVREPLSFIDGELISLEPTERRTRSDAGKSRRLSRAAEIAAADREVIEKQDELPF